MTSGRSINPALVTAGILILAIFAIDLVTPLGIAVWLLYLLPLFVGTWSSSQRNTFVLAGICIVLIIAGYFLSPSPVPGQNFAGINRALDTLVLAIAAVLLSQRHRTLQDLAQREAALQASQTELRQVLATVEDRVLKRTEELAIANEALAERESDLRKAADELREQARLLDLTNDAVIVRDMGARIRYLNRAAQERYGWSLAEVAGQESHTLFRTEFSTSRADTYRELLAAGQWEGELAHTTRDGRRIVVDSRWALMRDATGQALAVLETNNDITQRKQLEQQRESALAEVRRLNAELDERVRRRTHELSATANRLEIANQELESFSYSVSHDLRAPLRAIDGFSRILLEDHAGQLDNDALEYLQLVRDNTQQMGRLIDDLLAFSRLGRQALDRHPVSMAGLATEAWAQLKPEREGREVEFSLGEMTVCAVDAGLMRQVFVNLLSNALKFTRTQPVAMVEVGCNAGAEDRPVFFVRDNGVGFDPRYSDKLFRVFQRLHRAEDYEGTGVGLALVQRIVVRHGGRVWAEGQPDHGATFYFSLGPEGENTEA